MKTIPLTNMAKHLIALLRISYYRGFVLPFKKRRAGRASRGMEWELVIARYDEDIEWSDRFTEIRTVYNKGASLSIPIEKLPNIGREAHVYLHSIIVNWNDLADWTIFTQGDPFMHSPDFVELVEKRHCFEPVQPLSWRYLEKIDLSWVRGEHTYACEGVPPLSLRNRHRENWIEGLRVTVEHQNTGLSTVEPYHYIDDGLYEAIPEAAKRKDKALEYLWSKYGLEEPVEETIPFCYSAIFAVHRDRNRARGLNFYTNVMRIVLKGCVLETSRIVSTELERLWLQVFRYSTESADSAFNNPAGST